MSRSRGRSRSERRRVVIAWITVVVLVVGLGGTAVLLATGDDDPQAPKVDTSPTLSLSRTSTTGLLADSAASGGAPAGYQLDATLDQSPGQGVVIDPSASRADEAQVRALLTALGMTSPAIKEVGGGWTATGTVDGQAAKFALDEKAGNLWQYARGALADCLSVQPGAQPDDSVSCAASPQVATSSKGPGKAAVVREAKQLFALVGVTPGSGLQASDDGRGASVLDVPLTVEGLPVVDVNLSVSVDADGISSALGLLDPTYSTVGEYPLVSARAGFDQLGELPVPAIGRDCTGQGPECSDPKPAKVTGARLAWLTSQNAGSTVLVPAWQFEVDGFYGPAVVAVEPRYLTPAGGGTPEPDPASGSGRGSAVPGSSGGADGREPMTDPGTPEPADAPPDSR